MELNQLRKITNGSLVVLGCLGTAILSYAIVVWSLPDLRVIATEPVQFAMGALFLVALLAFFYVSALYDEALEKQGNNS